MDGPRVGVRSAGVYYDVTIFWYAFSSVCMYLSRCCLLVLCLVHSPLPPSLLIVFLYVPVEPTDGDPYMSTSCMTMHAIRCVLAVQFLNDMSRLHIPSRSLFKMTKLLPRRTTRIFV